MQTTSKSDTLLSIFGLGSALGLYGICLWGAPLVFAGDLFLGYRSTFSAIGVAGACLGFFMNAIAELLAIKNPFSRISFISLFLICGLGLFGFSIISPNILTTVTSALFIGFAISEMSLFWVKFISPFTKRPLRTSLALSLIVASATNIFLLIESSQNVSGLTCIAVALVEIASLSLCKDIAPHNKAQNNILAKKDRALSFRNALIELGVPLACASAMLIIIPIVNYVALNDGLSWQARYINIAGAQLVTACISLLVFKFASYPIMTKLLAVSMPTLTIMMFLLPFTDESFCRILLFIGTCIFFLVNIALMADCITIASIWRINILIPYGLCAGVTFLVRYITEQAMRNVATSGIPRDIQLIAAAFFAIYVLGFVFLLAKGRKQNDSASPSSIAKVLHADFSSQSKRYALDHIASAYGLSERESQIFEMIINGKNVPVIAEELFISQNTVRTHVKRIYRVLDVHSRQELIKQFESIAEQFK